MAITTERGLRDLLRDLRARVERAPAQADAVTPPPLSIAKARAMLTAMLEIAAINPGMEQRNPVLGEVAQMVRQCAQEHDETEIERQTQVTALAASMRGERHDHAS